MGVSFDASDEAINKGYKRQSLKWHPDRNLKNAEEASKRFQFVKLAHTTLSDATGRAQYDRILELRCYASQCMDVDEMIDPYLCFAVLKLEGGKYQERLIKV